MAGRSDASDASPWVPGSRDIGALETAAHDCRGCELWEPATQVVFSAGSPSASVMLVGEQPGDQEDRQGEVFIGPAGRLLDEALESAGIARDAVYVTNAVKHFRFEPRGKRRIHQKPDTRHVTACHPWLEAELEAVQPRVVVAMGATGARAVFGKAMRIGESRGQVLELSGDRSAIVTSHPSAVLRLRGKDGYDEAFGALVEDLRLAAPYV